MFHIKRNINILRSHGGIGVQRLFLHQPLRGTLRLLSTKTNDDHTKTQTVNFDVPCGFYSENGAVIIDVVVKDGTLVKENEHIMAIETGKVVLDIFAPVSGKIKLCVKYGQRHIKEKTLLFEICCNAQ